MKPNKPISEQVRHLIRTCGQTRYKISQATGIRQDVLSRFMSGESGLSMPILDRLGAYLELKIVMDKPKSGGK
jgi:hypothetical protein